MAFTRFNYDNCRTAKLLQESTGPGRYMLNVPGNGTTPLYYEDPHIRLQKWGANLLNTPNNHPIDIASDLDRRNVKYQKYCPTSKYPYSGVVSTTKNNYPIMKAYTDETRSSHPAWMYRDLPQTRWEYPLLNPQENVCMPFHNNVSTRILEKNTFIPKRPCIHN